MKIDRYLFASRRSERIADVVMAVFIGIVLATAMVAWWAA